MAGNTPVLTPVAAIPRLLALLPPQFLEQQLTLVGLQREVGHRAGPRRRLALPIQQHHHSHVAALTAQQDVGRVSSASPRLRPSTQQGHAADDVALQPSGGEQTARGGREQLDVTILLGLAGGKVVTSGWSMGSVYVRSGQ